MSRTTPSKVKEVLMRDYDDVLAPSLTPFIDAASLIVDDLEAAADEAPASARLALVETWLAAHAYVQSDQPYEEEWVGKAKATYQAKGKLGQGLAGSKYGRFAAELDTTGYLAGLIASAEGKRRLTAGADWLGKAPSEQTAWWERD